MPDNLYRDFLAGDDTLRIYVGDMLAFASKKDRLLPLMDYLTGHGAFCQEVTIYDKVMGNAAALLSALAHAREIFSPLGSRLAVKTLQKYNIKFHIDEVVPCIMRDDGKGMCPMEELSIGQSPKDFYKEMKSRISKTV